ncbi:MAG: hypothetical protein QOK16_609 [Solirubrobacteraceae bacterium]|nr:hypothetical protein [Solirubrobacteraceae bacterium]
MRSWGRRMSNLSRVPDFRGTGIERPAVDRLTMPIGTRLLPILGVSAALFGAVVDEGTRVVERLDYRQVISGTSLTTIKVEGPVIPFQVPTRMARIRALAPLSFREWAAVFGVSHSAVKQWADGDEPERAKIDRVLAALNEASSHRSDLHRWLTSPVPGMDVRPVDLLRDEHWRAFRGAIRARSAPAPSLSSEELTRRRQRQVSWAVPEPATVADDEA